MTRFRSVATVILPVLLVLGACSGDDQATDSPSDSGSAESVDSVAFDSNPPATAEQPVRPATVFPEHATGGWTELDPATLPAWTNQPCCGEYWNLDESPEFGDPDEPITPGVYYLAPGGWSPMRGSPLDDRYTFRLYRFRDCDAVPTDEYLWRDCPDTDTGIPPEDASWVDGEVSVGRTVRLDETIRVVVLGSKCSMDSEGGRGGAWIGDGTSLMALARELDADLTTWVLPTLFEDRDYAYDPDAMNLLAPAGSPFTPGCMGGIWWESNDTGLFLGIQNLTGVYDGGYYGYANSVFYPLTLEQGLDPEGRQVTTLYLAATFTS